MIVTQQKLIYRIKIYFHLIGVKNVRLRLFFIILYINVFQIKTKQKIAKNMFVSKIHLKIIIFSQ